MPLTYSPQQTFIDRKVICNPALSSTRFFTCSFDDFHFLFKCQIFLLCWQSLQHEEKNFTQRAETNDFTQRAETNNFTQRAAGYWACGMHVINLKQKVKNFHSSCCSQGYVVANKRYVKLSKIIGSPEMWFVNKRKFLWLLISGFEWKLCKITIVCTNFKKVHDEFIV